MTDDPTREKLALADDADTQAVSIVNTARKVYENHEDDGAWIAMESCYRHFIAAALRASVPADAVREAIPDNIPFKIWADKIENTTRTSVVRAADCYGSEQRVAHIECFYDFEAKRLVALLRALAALTPAQEKP